MLATLAVGSLCRADVRHAGPHDYLEALRRLQPGDTLVLAAGDYLSGLPVRGMVGTPRRPIVITGPKAGPPARFLARPGAHTVSIVDSAWTEIRNLELDGTGLPVSGVRAEGHAAWAHHITLEGLRIKGHGANQATVAIATYCPAWNWIIRNNTIERAGTGMYLGQADGTAPFVAGLIEGNTVADSKGYNVQIKHQRVRPQLDGMPQGSHLTIIRRNMFVKAGNSADGGMARPSVLVGHWPPTGPGSADTYAIYANLFYGNPSEALFQGEGNIALYSNVFVNTDGDAIRIQPHNDVPRRIEIVRNTVIAAGTGISVIAGDPQARQNVVGNAVFARRPIAAGRQQANVTGSMADAALYLAVPFAAPPYLDVKPKPGRLRAAIPLASDGAVLPDIELDFNGRAYALPLAGALGGL